MRIEKERKMEASLNTWENQGAKEMPVIAFLDATTMLTGDEI